MNLSLVALLLMYFNLAGGQWISRTRLLLEMYDGLLNDFFEQRDEIRTMALESSDEGFILRGVDFTELSEGRFKADEVDIRTSLEVARCSDPDSQEFFENFKVFLKKTTKILLDLQLMYALLSLGTPRLMSKHVGLKQLLNEIFRVGIFAGAVVLSRDDGDEYQANSRVALHTLERVFPATRETLSPIAKKWAQETPESEYLKKQLEVVNLHSKIVAECALINKMVTAGLHAIAIEKGDAVMVMPMVKSSLTTLRLDMRLLVEKLPSVTKKGPYTFVQLRRGAEMRLIEMDALAASIDELDT